MNFELSESDAAASRQCPVRLTARLYLAVQSMLASVSPPHNLHACLDAFGPPFAGRVGTFPRYPIKGSDFSQFTWIHIWNIRWPATVCYH